MPGISRRTFVKGAGAATGAAVVGGGSLALDRGPVGESEAIAPVVIGAGVAASVAVGWALRETEVIGSDPPPTGLTADALEQQIYQTARTRKSVNESTFVDNRNIIDGIENTLYTDAKIAAIESLNNGDNQSNVEAAANAKIDSYATTIKSNLLKSWNETAAEIGNMFQLIEDNSNLNFPDLFPKYGNYVDTDEYPDRGLTATRTVTLPDGTDFTLNRVQMELDLKSSTNIVKWDPISSDGDFSGHDNSVEFATSYGSVKYAEATSSGWSGIWNDLETAITNVRDGIVVWIDNVYGQVQSGAIQISDLLTPREQANLKADSEGYPQAVADLVALNIPVDLDREATISYSPNGDELTLSGSIGSTGSVSLSSGTTYDPASETGDFYLTYDVSQGSGVWTSFETAVDGGIVAFTKEPYANTVFSITTTAGETVEATAADFTDQGDGTFDADLSGKLETNITEVDGVTFSSDVSETQYETIQLKSPFTVEKIENSDGEEVSNLTYTKTDPQTDSNYITQEEWNQLEQQNQELIEKYNQQVEDTGTGGGAGGGFFADGGPSVGVIAAAGGGLALLYGLMGNQ